MRAPDNAGNNIAKKVPLFFICLAVLVTGILLLMRRQEMTGDEPRYFMYSMSLLKTGHFSMPLDMWKEATFKATGYTYNDLPGGGNARDVLLLNGVYLAALLSPVASIFSLAGLRMTTLIVGVIGLYYLLALCQRATDSRSAKIAVSVAALSMPLLPYLHLFYMETFVFTLICVSWERLQTIERRVPGHFLTAVLILIIPFVHMRGSVLAAVLYLALLWQIRASVKSVALFVGLGAAAFALLVELNIEIYGAVTGPINSARPPMPWDLFPVLAMQLFNIRHGLLAYAPVWLLGFAGLWVAALERNRIGLQALVLMIVAAATGIGVNPGECWPARFWVIPIPMMAVGFALWWVHGKNVLARTVTVALILFTLVNTVYFIRSEADFLSNRQSSVTYQNIFDRVGHFQPGLALPVENDDPMNVAAARNLALGAGLAMVFLIISARRKNWIAAVPAGLILLTAMDLSRFSEIPADRYIVSTTPDSMTVSFRQPVDQPYIQFGHPDQAWYYFAPLPKFAITSVAHGTSAKFEMNGNQVVPIHRAQVNQVNLQTTTELNVAEQAAYRVRIYENRSILRRLRWQLH